MLSGDLFKIWIRSAEVEVKCPYSTLFVDRARELGGIWSQPTSTWVFPPLGKDLIMEALDSIYGLREGARVVRVRLTARADLEWDRCGADYHNYPLCRAFGKRSGAKPSEGVLLACGSIGSGGSSKNWTTTVSKGTQFLLKVLDTVAGGNEDFDCEILPEPGAGDSPAAGQGSTGKTAPGDGKGAGKAAKSDGAETSHSESQAALEAVLAELGALRDEVRDLRGKVSDMSKGGKQ